MHLSIALLLILSLLFLHPLASASSTTTYTTDIAPPHATASALLSICPHPPYVSILDCPLIPPMSHCTYLLVHSRCLFDAKYPRPGDVCMQCVCAYFESESVDRWDQAWLRGTNHSVGEGCGKMIGGGRVGEWVSADRRGMVEGVREVGWWCSWWMVVGVLVVVVGVSAGLLVMVLCGGNTNQTVMETRRGGGGGGSGGGGGGGRGGGKGGKKKDGGRTRSLHLRTRVIGKDGGCM